MSQELVIKMDQLAMYDIKKFTFSKPTFDGRLFYLKHKNAEFLKGKENLFLILAKYDELEEHCDSLEPNEEFTMEGMYLAPKIPLVIKNSKCIDESDVEQDDFTLRRLAGLVAVHIFNNKLPEFVNIYSVKAEEFSIKKPYFTSSAYDPWPKTYYGFVNYLSASPGTEYYPEYFGYIPFLFALRRYQLKQISDDELIEIANIRHPDTMEPLAIRCSRDYKQALNTCQDIRFDLKAMLVKLPQNVKQFFKKIYV